MRLLLLTLTLLVSAAPLAFAAARETHPLDVRDLVAFDRISEPRVSPDGSRVVFTVSSVDLDANRRRTDLWIAPLDGSGARRLTRHEAGDTSAVWAPDGKSVYFLTTRSGSSQVFRLPLDGGEAQPVTTLPLDVGSFLLSPDGSTLLVSMEVFPGTTPAETKKRQDDEAANKASGKVYETLFFRHWDAWADGRRSHLFAVKVSAEIPWT